jgi:general secretion pathway protein H
MRTSAAGSRHPRTGHATSRGFTLLELLVVIAIIALGTATVGLALRDSGDTALERDAQRLAALLEAARAQSRATGVPVGASFHDGGYRFNGLSPAQAEGTWLDSGTRVFGSATLVLGPEPIGPPQHVVLGQASRPDRQLTIASDGLRPFAVGPP